jgi:hypothetical protein
VCESTILPDNLEALIYAAKVTRRPYMTPAGPDALNLNLSAYAVAPGTAVTLTLTLNDSRYHNQSGVPPEPVQDIHAAEYSVDAPLWQSGVVTYSIAAADGSFDSSVEDGRAVIDTTGLSVGRHILYTRGQDAAGNWGAVSAEFLYIIDPAVSPIISGVVTAADTGQPLTATVRTDSIFQTSANASGAYQMQVISGTYQVTAVPGNTNYAAATAAVTAHDSQTVTQDFQLYPYCTVFNDDVEGGTNGWITNAPWAITTELAHSASHSWTDSPGGNYGNNLSISLTSPTLDLSGYTGIQINFWQICATEGGYDYCVLEASPNNGTTWEELARWDGANNSWSEVTQAASVLNGQSEAKFRFRLSTDQSVVRDGWHVDDIRVIGAGSGCVQAEALTAAFTSTSPVVFGESISFTNTSTGGNLSFLWDFGDGVTSTLTSPAHLYAAPGVYTVTLTAVNTTGSDSSAQQVVVEPHYLYLPLLLRQAIARPQP